MLRSIRIRNFRCHANFELSFGDRLVLRGPNGSGKTSVLEAVYALVNAELPSGRSVAESVRVASEAAVLSGIVENGWLAASFSAHFDAESGKASYAREKTACTRPAYRRALAHRAILFHPLEMNLLYLAPSLRRDFLDETLAIAHGDVFRKVRSEYAGVLRSRNRVLKDVREGRSRPADLDLWDRMFVGRAEAYMRFRFMIAGEIERFLPEIMAALADRYRIVFRYGSKTDPARIADSIAEYLAKNRERDILVGHTPIGPHVDDFEFFATVDAAAGTEERAAASYLSRGETKTLLLALKALQVKYVEDRTDATLVLLLDDFLSELDEAHVDLALELFSGKQMIMTTQLSGDGPRAAGLGAEEREIF